MRSRLTLQTQTPARHSQAVLHPSRTGPACSAESGWQCAHGDEDCDESDREAHHVEFRENRQRREKTKKSCASSGYCASHRRATNHFQREAHTTQAHGSPLVWNASGMRLKDESFFRSVMVGDMERVRHCVTNEVDDSDGLQ